MRITIDVPEFDAEQVTTEMNKITHKILDVEGVATLFAQDLINRYFNIEYLDTDIMEENCL